VLREQKERDDRDKGREHSPLMQAPDAILFDTTGLGIDEVVRKLVTLVEEALRP
jgi:CMP/dCMP kinase